MIISYLKSRYQRIKENSSFCDWEELLTSVPQGSTLGTLLLNIYLNDLSCLVDNSSICNVADDATPYSCGYKIDKVIKNMEDHCAMLVVWLRDNFLTLNADKCHLLFTRLKFENMFARVYYATLWEEDSLKLLGILKDSKDLSFDKHVKMICKKNLQKVTALLRMVNVLTVKQRKLLIKSFIEAQFNHCPLLWMF